MSMLPTEIVRMIMGYRGTNTFESLSHELDITKNQNLKWKKDILNRIIKAEQEELMPYKQYQLLMKHRVMREYKKSLNRGF